MPQLAIATPGIGVISETFIRRHVNDLWPGDTCIIAETRKKPHCGQWQTDNAVFIIDEQEFKTDKSILARSVSKTRRLFKLSDGSEKSNGIKAFLKEQNVKVFMAEYLDFSIYYLPICRELGIKYFAHAHGYDISSRVKDPYWRKRYLELNRGDGIITMSHFSKAVLLDIGITIPIHVIPYGIIPQNLSNEKAKSSTIRFLASGRLVSKKAPLVTLKAFQIAQKKFPDMILTFVGSGDLKPMMEKFILENHLEEQVHLTGSLPNNEVLAHMANSDIYLQHSVVCPETGDMEGLPVSILEAMSAGLPIVSTRHAGIPESVLEGQNGYLVEEFDVEAMADKMIQLVENENLRLKMKLANIERANTFFHWETERKKLIEVLRLG
jgi:colanic acid/amylovoran biosynthesis glycosyltransferase